MGEEGMYCGIKKVPSGKARGTPRYCAETKQVRYYGVEPIDPEILKITRIGRELLQHEALRLRKMENTARALIQQFDTIKYMLERKTVADRERKKYKRMLEALGAKKKRLAERLRKQQAKVKEITIEIKHQEELQERDKKKREALIAKAAKKKSSSKSSSKGSSKSSSKGSSKSSSKGSSKSSSKGSSKGSSKSSSKGSSKGSSKSSSKKSSSKTSSKKTSKKNSSKKNMPKRRSSKKSSSTRRNVRTIKRK